MKNNSFILPEKWYIRGCKELVRWQLNDRGNKCNCNFLFEKCYYFNTNKNLADESWDFCKSNPVGIEITFEQFKKYVLKEETMRKELFTIEGSESLKKAFIEESKLKDSDIEYHDYLCPSSLIEGALTSIALKYPKHFVLPQEWHQALDYVAMYFTEVCKWDVGTYIVFLRNYGRSVENQIDKIKSISDDRTQMYLEHEGCCTQDPEFVKWFATKEEAEEFVKLNTLSKPKFQIGDSVILISTNSSVGCKLIETGRYHEGAKPHDVVKIIGITTRYGNASKEDPRYYGENFNARACDLKLATKEEIKKHKDELLLAEAKKRYPVGTNFRAARGSRCKYIVKSSSEFRVNGDGAVCIKDSGNGTVYYDDVWAEILPLYPEINIRGYKAEFFDDYVKFGCQKYTKDFIIALNNCLVDNNLTMEYRKEIREIAEYFLDKDA